MANKAEKQLRILFLCHCLTGGGAERVCAEIANGLTRRGHHVAILTNLNVEQTYMTLPEVKLIQTATGHGLRLRMDIYRRYRQVFREERPDVVIPIMHYFSLLAKIAAHGLNIPIVLSDHNSYERPKIEPFTVRSWVDKFVVNRFMDGLTVLTHRDLELAQGLCPHVEVMENPLFLKPLDEPAPSRRKVLLACGRVNDWIYKGFDILIRSFSKIASRYPEWTIEIAGGGSDASVEELRAIAREAGVDGRLVFSGRHNDMVSLYRSASVFVLSSRYEGFGLVLIEAMSQGCACIACDYKGRQREIMPSDDIGLTVPADNEEALTVAMERMITDEAYRESTRERAIARSRHYESARIAEQWEKYLYSVISY